MSPRKPTSSAAEASSHEEEESVVAEGSKTTGSGTDPVETGVNVEDYLLPRTLTQRLAKAALPPNTSIQKDALLAISKAATVFVSYLSSHANEETEKKTVTPQDVFAALSQIEFDAFLPRLERELAVYTEATAQKRRGKKDRKSAPANATATAATTIVGGLGGVGGMGGASAADEAENIEDGVEPGAKRVKRNGEGGTEMAIGRPRPGVGGGKGVEGRDGGGDGGDGDETEEMEEEQDDEEEEDEVEEDEDEGEEEEEEEEEEATQHSGQGDDEIDIDADASDTARRRREGMHPDLDSGLESDSDGL
ncbi:hypothetical protein EMCG_08551 [[Emmonsia] crescens]|uniref:DNA polymerase epsilon subunit D n=1 Tax=[Emmonsia] crescens TaxID=73230 RepID=A0A0G2I5B2_9EURO|nr:hypothetical protein EMCG_08551 [Emmonsia crescens UAMH 3008]